MREFLIRILPRLFAVLGCSTLVTACYGVPYDDYHIQVDGKVIDAETGGAIEAVQVKITAGYRSQGGNSAVQGLAPVVSTTVSTAEDGSFGCSMSSHVEPDGVMIECCDIDGKANGAYYPESKVYNIEEADGVVIELERDND